MFFRTEPLRKEDTDSIARLVIRDPQVRGEVGTLREYDCAYAAPGVGRFRVNVYRQRGTLGIVMRSIPTKIPTFEELGAPRRAQYLAERERGLVLVVGAAGNGKSSTLAAMIGHLNRTQPLHIVTIEDPIEFLHDDDKSSISQREVGIDTGTFADALRAALRQDPDVILVGEIRDELTLDIALKAAETGHLVLSTLHTPDVARTVGRMLALAPRNQPGSSDELRERIGDALQGIVAQRLLPRKDGQGLVLAAEVLVATGTVREIDQAPRGKPDAEGADGEGHASVRDADLRDAPEAALDAGPARERNRAGGCGLLSHSHTVHSHTVTLSFGAFPDGPSFVMKMIDPPAGTTMIDTRRFLMSR